MFSGKNNHYEPAAWVDFVRALVDQKTHKEMQAHLDSGCQQCGNFAGFFSDIVRRAAVDSACHIPDYAIRNIRSVYALQRPEEVQLLPRTVARLVYDSFREPLLAGVRSQQQAAHQLMYVAGAYAVDLRMEQEPGSPHVRLIGQIANQDRAAGVPDVPVFLLSQNSVLCRTSTNHFGEFAMLYAPSNGLRIFAPIPGENHIEVRLGTKSAQRRKVRK